MIRSRKGEKFVGVMYIIPARVNYQQKFPFLEFCVTENFIFWVCVTFPANGS